MLKFSPEMVNRIVGEYVLLGINFVRDDGHVLARKQIYGQVLMLDVHHGLVIRNRKRGEEYVLPPDVSDWQPGGRGSYVMSGSGEVVHDPDWLGEMTLEVPPGVDLNEHMEVDVTDPLPEDRSQAQDRSRETTTPSDSGASTPGGFRLPLPIAGLSEGFGTEPHLRATVERPDADHRPPGTTTRSE